MRYGQPRFPAGNLISTSEGSGNPDTCAVQPGLSRTDLQVRMGRLITARQGPGDQEGGTAVTYKIKSAGHRGIARQRGVVK